MKHDCQQVRRAARVSLEVDASEERHIVVGALANDFQQPIWVPQELVPAYRVDPTSGNVVVSYGYFDDIYERFKANYMLPPMKEVAPRERLRWQIEDPALIEKLLIPGVQSVLRVRVSLKQFPECKTRGSQPVDEYIKESCSLHSEEIVLRPS